MSANVESVVAEEEKVSLPELFLIYLRIGLTAFGPAMAAETKKNIIKKRKWIREEEFLNGLALAQLLPGATFASLTVYIGYRLRGVAGAMISLLGLLLPSFFFMVLLSYLYFRYGQVPLISILFKGIVAIVVGLVANATWEIGTSAIKDLKGAVIALVSFGMMVLYPNIFIILLIAAIAGILLFYPAFRQRSGLPGDERSEPGEVSRSRYLKTALVIVAVIASFFILVSLQPVLLKMALVFFRIGILVFGNGYTMLPLIQQEVVTNYHWLGMNDFAAGLALGQITPGPVLIMATFIGYKVASWTGAVVSTVGIFLPCLLLVALTAEVHQKIQHSPWVRSVFKGIVASFPGMMLMVIFGLARHSLVDVTTAALAVAAFLTLRFTKIDIVWVVTGGAVVYLLLTRFIQIF
jgi:chromate transporter